MTPQTMQDGTRLQSWRPLTLEPGRCTPEVVAVQPLSRVQLFATPWAAAPQASLSLTISQSLLKLMATAMKTVRLYFLGLQNHCRW